MESRSMVHKMHGGTAGGPRPSPTQNPCRLSESIKRTRRLTLRRRLDAEAAAVPYVEPQMDESTFQRHEEIRRQLYGEYLLEKLSDIDLQLKTLQEKRKNLVERLEEFRAGRNSDIVTPSAESPSKPFPPISPKSVLESQGESETPRISCTATRKRELIFGGFKSMRSRRSRESSAVVASAATSCPASGLEEPPQEHALAAFPERKKLLSFRRLQLLMKPHEPPELPPAVAAAPAADSSLQAAAAAPPMLTRYRTFSGSLFSKRSPT